MNILCPIPKEDFDPTELAIPWQKLVLNGHSVTFATPDGLPGTADLKMVTGRGLGFLKFFLMADKTSLAAFKKCIQSKEFTHPISYSAIVETSYDALLLPGGHAKGMKTYLESGHLQKIIVAFFAAKKPVGAICHGTLLVGRSIDPSTGKSVLFNKKTTGLNFSQEFIAWILTCLWLGKYYRTYSTYMAHELRSYLKSPTAFIPGPLPLKRDTPTNLDSGFTVLDSNYLSARWPGDANRFAANFLDLLANQKIGSSTNPAPK